MSLHRDRSAYTKAFQVAPYPGSPFIFGLDGAAVMHNKFAKFDGTEPVVLAFHGHSGSGLTFGVPNYVFGHQLVELARTGYIVVSIDAGGPNGWPSPMVETIMLAAYAWATAPHVAGDLDFTLGLGGKPGKVGVYGYSMGGGNAVTFAKNHPDKVAACIALAPAINLDVFLPLYEIDILYARAYATKVSGTQTVNQTPVDLVVGDTSMFTAAGFTVPGFAWRLGSSGAVSMHYTGIDATHILGATVTSGSITVSNNNIVIAPYNAYVGNEGFDATNDAALGQYSPGAYNVPTRIVHGDADATVLPVWISDFLALANNPIIENYLLPGATHTSLFQFVASDRDVDWLGKFLH